MRTQTIEQSLLHSFSTTPWRLVVIASDKVAIAILHEL